MLIFSKGSRTNDALVIVMVKSGAPPSVLIRPLNVVKVNPTKILAIESLIRSKKSVTAVWSSVQSEGIVFNRHPQLTYKLPISDHMI